MPRRKHIFGILAVIVVSLNACRTTDRNPETRKTEFSPEGIPINWGSLNPMVARPTTAEDKAANAAARRLNEAARLKDLLIGLPANAMVVDGIVSIPTKLIDLDAKTATAQKSANIGWSDWPEGASDVPLAFTLAQVKTATTDARLLVIEPATTMIESLYQGTPPTIWAELSDDNDQRTKIALVKDDTRGVYRAVIAINGLLAGLTASAAYPAYVTQGTSPWLAALAEHWAWPRVKIRFHLEDTPTDSRYWPILFRFPTQKREQAQTSLPTADSKFADGRDISLAPYTHKTETTTYEMLHKWYAEQASADNIEFVDGAFVRKTLVGKTQILYPCFAPSTPAAAPQWSVPAESGWYGVGRAIAGQNKANQPTAETIINSLEDTGIFAGWGTRAPYPFSGAAPYDAKDIVSFRILRPDEVYTIGAPHFRWYAIDATRKVCHVLWKHLGCDLASDRDLRCQN